MTLLTDRDWPVLCDSDEASLLTNFYEPALKCAVTYDRTTGYFSARILTLAARGIEGLIRNGGKMRLIVGCTLGEPEVAAIERGQTLGETLNRSLGDELSTAENAEQTDALELLAWMVAKGHLDVKVGVRCQPDGRFVPHEGIFHEKSGVISDSAGNRLAFSGSINETGEGWTTGNWESFHVFTDWRDGSAHVEAEAAKFTALWEDRRNRVRVLDIPDAIRLRLLEHAPPDGEIPRRLREEATDPDADRRRLIWGIVRHAPSLANGGDRVGEATAAVTPWPHQVRSYERLYQSWPPRLLIADEVGLGKTITAGLLLRQAWLSGRAKRILILAPHAVLRQWQTELHEKFNLSWPIYDNQSLTWPAPVGGTARSKNVGVSEWHKEPFVFASSQLMRRRDRRSELLERAEPYDLVVLDEAHHARRRGGARDTRPNQLLGLMKGLKERTDGLLLLTATPMQTDPVEIWDLLELLGLPEEWSESAFLTFFDRVANDHISPDEFDRLSSLFRVSERSFGEVSEAQVARAGAMLTGLSRRTVLAALRDEARTPRRQLSPDQRSAALALMRVSTPVGGLIVRHTRELLRSYRNSGALTAVIADRNVSDSFVDLTDEERRVYEAVEDYISTTYNKYLSASAQKRNAIGFVMTIYRRRLASSFAALHSTLSKHLRDVLERSSVVEFSEEDAPDDETNEAFGDPEFGAEMSREALLEEESSELESLIGMVDRLSVDTKARRLVEHINEMKADGYRQVMVFTQYTDTMDYIRTHLATETDFPVMCYSGRGGEVPESDGSWRTVSRDQVKRRFARGDVDVLLCTDAAAEGLNFQFCGALINYDMPWNPMRVEQRIGRIDRLGQAYPTIRVVNMYYANTVESDVYMTLRDSINLFVQYVGKLQPILARLPGRFEQVTLQNRDDREAAREDLRDTFAEEVATAQATGFDLDESATQDLEVPDRPDASYDLDDLDMLLLSENLLPPDVNAEPLGAREYSYIVADESDPVRVTTDREYYDQHPESVELWSPGGAHFPAPEDVASPDEVEAVGKTLHELLTEASSSSAGT